jgi:hypothetical protein
METYGEVEMHLHHSWPRHKMEMRGQLHAPDALTPGKSPPVPIGCNCIVTVAYDAVRLKYYADAPLPLPRIRRAWPFRDLLFTSWQTYWLLLSEFRDAFKLLRCCRCVWWIVTSVNCNGLIQGDITTGVQSGWGKPRKFTGMLARCSNPEPPNHDLGFDIRYMIADKSIAKKLIFLL